MPLATTSLPNSGAASRRRATRSACERLDRSAAQGLLGRDVEQVEVSGLHAEADVLARAHRARGLRQDREPLVSITRDAVQRLSPANRDVLLLPPHRP